MLSQFTGNHRVKARDDGTGHFYKEFVPKPPALESVPRRYGRYGLPFSIVEKELRKLSSPDLIFVTSGMTYWYPGVMEMVSLLKRVFKGIPVILGGIYATLCPEHAAEFSGADKIVVGEGEVEALSIADEVTGNHSDSSRYQNLEDFPSPLYDLYPRLTSAALLTSRGCPYRCPFCASHLLSKKYRRRNPSSVVDEIEYLTRKKGVVEFAFYDDALLYKKGEHFVPFLYELIERKLNVHFHTPNGIQPREVDQKTAKLMQKAGFRTIRLSYETSDKNRQKSMGFKVKDEDLINAVNNLIEAGFEKKEIGSYILMGLPGQSIEEVIESMIFVLKLGIKVSLASFSPIPGTQSWREAVERSLINESSDLLLTNNSVFSIITNTIPLKIFWGIGSLAAEANRIINRGGLPLEDYVFRELMKTINGGPID